MESEVLLFAESELPRRDGPPVAKPVPPAAPRLRTADRRQLLMQVVDIEGLIGAEHPARAIWELMGRCDLSGFGQRIAAVEGGAGRPAWDPQVLVSVWIYAYSDATPSAREIERQCEHNPAYQWLTGAQAISAHTLSDFRTAHAAALEDLAAQVLTVLAGEGLFDLQQVALDGTKIRASAGSDTFRREATIQQRLQQAREHILQLESAEPEQASRQALAGRQRAAKEKAGRMEQALEELQQVRKGQAADKHADSRVSLTDPQARIMKQNDGGYAPSYNVQVATDTKHGVVLSVAVTQDGADSGQLMPAMDRVQRQTGRAPSQAVVDAGYTTRENVVGMAERGIVLVGPPPTVTTQSQTLYQIRGVAAEFRAEAFAYDAAANCFRCPAGQLLPYKSKCTEAGRVKYSHAAPAEVCRACEHKQRCCPTSNGKTGRMVVRTEEGPALTAFRERMATEEAQAEYRRRGAVAEFSNLWFKEKLGVRRFSVRGLVKAQAESLWLGLTLNVQHWIRLCWRPRLASAA